MIQTNLRTIQAILALLFMGSVSLVAQNGNDPFPEVPQNWQGTMTVICQVQLNALRLTEDVIVAAYNTKDGQIRGKESVDTEGIVYLSIAGDANTDVPIHFKVYTGGRIIEVDQEIKFIWDDWIGSYKDPYIINLPLVTTTTSSEGWGTTCLPYNAAMPDGVTVYAAKEIDGNVLRLTPITGTILPKNTPVLLKTDGQQSVEWLSRVADGDATIDTNLFKGTTEATTVEAESVLTLGHATDGDQAIGFWLYSGTNIPANRAYLERVGSSRGLTLNWEDNSLGIGAALNDKGEMTNDNCFDLLGRSMKSSTVNSQSSIFNGQIRITNGKKYMVR